MRYRFFFRCTRTRNQTVSLADILNLYSLFRCNVRNFSFTFSPWFLSCYSRSCSINDIFFLQEYSTFRTIQKYKFQCTPQLSVLKSRIASRYFTLTNQTVAVSTICSSQISAYSIVVIFEISREHAQTKERINPENSSRLRFICQGKKTLVLFDQIRDWLFRDQKFYKEKLPRIA